MNAIDNDQFGAIGIADAGLFARVLPGVALVRLPLATTHVDRARSGMSS